MNVVTQNPSSTKPATLDAEVLTIAGVVVLGSIMSILDITVVNVALPTFMEDLGVELLSTVTWTVTAYTLALAAVIPITGWAADRFGTKRLYMLALGLFTLGSVLCATAWNIEALVAFRVVQGLGGGMLMPLGMTIMTRAAGPERMGRLMAVLGVPMLLGPILGPILGGWLIEAASWHWIFLINLPLGIAAIVYAAIVLKADEPQENESFDFIGMLMMSPGLASLLYGISSSVQHGWGNWTHVRGPAFIGAVLVIAFVFHSFRPEHPLLDLRLFKDYTLTIAVITMFLFVAAFFGGMLLMPTYFQQIHGETPKWAGIYVAAQGIGAMVTMPLAGILADRFPVGRIVPFGMLLICGGMFALTTIGADTQYRFILPVLFVMGLGMGLTMMPIMTSALRTLQPHEIARGSTLLNIFQQIGSSVGVAIIAVILQRRLSQSAEVPGMANPADSEPITEAGLGVLSQLQPETFQGILAQVPPEQAGILETIALRGLDFAAGAFAHTFGYAFVFCLVALAASLFLPKRHEKAKYVEDQGEAPVVIG